MKRWHKYTSFSYFICAEKVVKKWKKISGVFFHINKFLFPNQNYFEEKVTNVKKKIGTSNETSKWWVSEYPFHLCM